MLSTRYKVYALVPHFTGQRSSTSFHGIALQYLISRGSALVPHFTGQCSSTSFHGVALQYLISRGSALVPHFTGQCSSTSFHGVALHFFFAEMNVKGYALNIFLIIFCWTPFELRCFRLRTLCTSLTKRTVRRTLSGWS